MPLVFEKKRQLSHIFTDCAGTRPSPALLAPLKLPVNWSRVLRLGPVTRLSPEELLQVCMNFDS